MKISERPPPVWRIFQGIRENVKPTGRGHASGEEGFCGRRSYCCDDLLGCKVVQISGLRTNLLKLEEKRRPRHTGRGGAFSKPHRIHTCIFGECERVFRRRPSKQPQQKRQTSSKQSVPASIAPRKKKTCAPVCVCVNLAVCVCTVRTCVCVSASNSSRPCVRENQKIKRKAQAKRKTHLSGCSFFHATLDTNTHTHTDGRHCFVCVCACAENSAIERASVISKKEKQAEKERVECCRL